MQLLPFRSLKLLCQFWKNLIKNPIELLTEPRVWQMIYV